VAVGGSRSGHESAHKKRIVHPLPAKKSKMNVFFISYYVVTKCFVLGCISGRY